MKVLIISANFLPASPSGPAYIAGAALEAGHDVEVFEALFAKDLIGELKAHLDRFTPEVVAISIRLVNGFILDENAQYGTRHLDLRIKVKEIVECIKQNLDANIVLGGPGFNYYGPGWNESDLACIKELLESGKVKPVIDRCYSLSEVPDALRYLGEGHAQGKIVISI